MKLYGKELNLFPHEPSITIRSKNFRDFNIGEVEKFYMPESLERLNPNSTVSPVTFFEDDNRGAISPWETCNIGGTEFHLSIKGVGSTVDPYSLDPLNIHNVSELTPNREFGNTIENSGYNGNRFITGETWLRGSPYGGQGLELASIALKTSEMADPTSINGFRIAPVVSIVSMEKQMQEKIKELYWYRKYEGEIVQELRLMPSNVRLYFHASSTVGNDVSKVFDMFELNTDQISTTFMENFMRSGIAALTAFSRTLRKERDDIYSGVDYFDVWLDKDAVISKDGTIYFVDLEGVERRFVTEDKTKETITDQFYRSLYELMYAYARIDEEQVRRYGSTMDKRTRLQMTLEKALRNDKYVKIEVQNGKLDLIIGNDLNKDNLNTNFTMLNRVV